MSKLYFQMSIQVTKLVFTTKDWKIWYKGIKTRMGKQKVTIVKATFSINRC